jgi:hypothetical protein
MFNEDPTHRLRAWHDFRNSITESTDPIQDTIDLYRDAPSVCYQVDPYNQDTWPTPWELLAENQYCDFAKILGIGYTIQLSDLFTDADYEIYIITDTESSQLKYLLYIDDKVVGYDPEKAVVADKIPLYNNIERRYTLTKHQ